MKIGVLALQGSVEEHKKLIETCGDTAFSVRYPEELENIDALIIPGGESTTLTKLLKIKNMDSAIKNRALAGLPVWGTCAGLILLSKNADHERVETLDLIDIDTKRNGYGTQVDSFTAELVLNGEESSVRFIRAPRIIRTGDDVKVISTYNNEVVAALSKNIFVTAFHPEVTGDKTFYNFFRSIIEKQK